MQAIERIRVAMYHESDDLEFACNPAAMTEVLAHIDALTAELAASDIAIAEYRQQRLDNAAEIARLRIESEERLQNCAALIAENEHFARCYRRSNEGCQMTTITIDREVCEQAAALLNPDRSPSALFHQRRDCAEAIRAALSAPATTTPEPFAYTTGTYGWHFTLEPMNPAITIPKGFALYLHPPATAPEQCWCRTCRPITQADNRMVLCPDCGNKRCPKATDHRNACTGSNEPGQPGSSYPTVPATAPEQPAWHDAPTVPGLWVCNYGALSVTAVNQPDIDAFDPAYNAGGRWFGPIPEDKS